MDANVRDAAERVLAYFKTLPCPSVMFQDSAEVARAYLILAARPAADDAERVLKLEAQVFKMAEWLMVEKNIATDAIADGIMVEAHKQRIEQINGLLSGSAGESYLRDLWARAEAARPAAADEAVCVRCGHLKSVHDTEGCSSCECHYFANPLLDRPAADDDAEALDAYFMLDAGFSAKYPNLFDLSIDKQKGWYLFLRIDLVKREASVMQWPGGSAEAVGIALTKTAIETRGHVRGLCAALGIQLQEGKPA